MLASCKNEISKLNPGTKEVVFENTRGNAKNLRSRNRIEQLLASYKNSNIKRTVNFSNHSFNSFIFYNEPVSFRINFINIYDKNAVNVTTLRRITSVSKRTDTLIKNVSQEFLHERNVHEENGNIKIILKCEYIQNKCENLSNELSKACVINEEKENDTQNLNVSKMMDIEQECNTYNSDSVICLDSCDFRNDGCANVKVEINNEDHKISARTSNVSSNLELNDSIIFVKQYCGRCGISYDNGNKEELKRKHCCDSSILLKRKKTELDAEDRNSLDNLRTLRVSLENIENTIKRENIKQTKEIGLSPIILPSTPRCSAEDNSIETSPKLTVSCSMQTSPINYFVTDEVGCNSSNNDPLKNNNHSFINSPRTKKILDYLDKKYANIINSVHHCNKSHCSNSGTSSLAVIQEENGSQDKAEENKSQLKVSDSTSNNKNVNGTDDGDFEPVCVDRKSINYVFGYNFYGSHDNKNTGLKLIVIDGSNVAFGHSKGKYFSAEGLKICIDYFLQRGHKVKAFVPQFRLKHRYCSNTKLLERLYIQGHVVFTPSREINGQIQVPYDDRFIVQCADIYNAVIVSNDNYRDLIQENPLWKRTIEKNLLMVTWVDDVIIFPPDPLGRYGPTLERFLRYP